MTQLRGADGKFAPGNSGGPGRKPREVEAELLETLEQSVRGEKWQQICDKAIEQAIKGKPSARNWISNYLIGAPKQRADADAVSGWEAFILGLRQLNVSSAAQAPVVVDESEVSTVLARRVEVQEDNSITQQ